MKLSLLIFCIALCVAPAAHAQQNLKNGFIISNAGDTLRGTVRIPVRQKNPEKIEFIQNGSGSAVEYKPLDIREFKFDNDSYVSAIVETEKDQKAQNDSYGKSTWIRTADTVFLETIVRGTKSVFQLNTGDGGRFFYIFRDGRYDLLTYRKTIVTQPNGLMALSESKLYQGQLSAYLNDCPSLQSALKSTAYEKRSIELLFKQYYKCTGVKLNYTKNTETQKLEFGVMAGVSLNSLDLESKETQNKALDKAKFASSVNPAFGVFLNIAGAGKFSPLSLHGELMYRSLSTTGDSQEEYTTNSFNYNHYTFKVSHIKINGMLRLTFPVAKARLFLNAGFSARFQTGITNRRTTQKTYLGAPVAAPPDGEMLPNGTNKGGFNPIYGVGGGFNRYSLEFRYESDAKFPRPFAISSTSTNFYFLLSYRL